MIVRVRDLYRINEQDMAARMEDTPERTAFYDTIAPQNLAPLWKVLSNVVTPEPTTDCQPALWSFDSIREHLVTASGLISAKEAERRVLVLENPAYRGQTRFTNSLFSGIQMVAPREVAPAHRHSQSALRLVLESTAGSTVVNGEATRMQYGDFVITPQWAWHDHANESDTPAFWQDVLDIPMVSYFAASFAEGLGHDSQEIDTPQGDSLARYGANMMPLGYESRAAQPSPIFNYPYDRSREALEQMRRAEQWDPWHGLKMRYVNPVNGDWAMPTIGTCLQLLPKGFRTQSYQSTDSTGFTVVEGKGRSWIGNQVFEWAARDIFVVPSWYEVVHEADEDAVLFSYSDRPVQEKIGLFRERRGNTCGD